MPGFSSAQLALLQDDDGFNGKYSGFSSAMLAEMNDDTESDFLDG